MNLTIALVVSLFCGVLWAQDNVTVVESEDSGAVNVTWAGGDPQRELMVMKEKLAEMETRLNSGGEKLAELETWLNKVRYTVAFTAATGGGANSIGPYNKPTTLVYRTVKTNIGNFYNQNTGIFTAPVPGLYFFTYFYHAKGDEQARLFLMKNSESVVLASDHKSNYDGADNGGNAAYLQLQRGDQVYVQMAANTHVWGNDVSTTFSGVLVHQN